MKNKPQKIRKSYTAEEVEQINDQVFGVSIFSAIPLFVLNSDVEEFLKNNDEDLYHLWLLTKEK